MGQDPLTDIWDTWWVIRKLVRVNESKPVKNIVKSNSSNLYNTIWMFVFQIFILVIQYICLIFWYLLLCFIHIQ